jgi:choline-sulfatase
VRAISLFLVLSVWIGCSRSDRPNKNSTIRNVLLVTIDTLRADRVGAGIAPALDRLAASGVRFRNARAVVPLTLPSHTTLLTGLLPTVHGVRENGRDRLSDAHVTIARALKAAGYDTAAFVGAFVLDRRFGLAQGFDTYDDQIPRDPRATERLEAERPASAVVDRAIAWLDARPPTTNPESPVPHPFFIWVHLYDPHAPYNPPPDFRARARSAYDGEVSYADAHVARLIEWLSAHQLTASTLIVVAGDHGEGLGDHGEATHGMLLYDATLRVPLILSSPLLRSAAIDEPVTLAEIAPTILRAAGVTPPDAMRGRDLVRLEPGTTITRANMSGDARSVPLQPDLYAETEYPRVAGWSPLQALTDGRWKAIRAGTATELYDLPHDPEERHDLAASQASTAAALATRLDAIRASAKETSVSSAISADAQERLRALGYVASSVQAAATDHRPNPSTTIAVWNEFEEALSALNAHQPDALPRLAKLASANPDAPVFQTTYARALADAHRANDALTAYRAAARKWPTDATLLHGLAAAARDAGRTDEAQKADEAAMALAPDNPVAHNGAGLIAIDRRQPADAAREFERAAALDPTNATYWANLGNAKRTLGDGAGAEHAYRRALDVDPRSADAANGLGVLLVEAQRPAEAVRLFERAVAAAPDFVEAKLNLGIALQQAGQRDRAATVYRDVLAAPATFTREREAAAKLLAALGHSR